MSKAQTYSPIVMWFWKAQKLIKKGSVRTLLDAHGKRVLVTINGNRPVCKAYASPRARHRSMLLAGVDSPMSLPERINQLLDDVDTWLYLKKKKRDLAKGIYETERERLMISIDSIRKGSIASRIKEFDKPSILVNKAIFGISHNHYYRDLTLKA